MVMNATKAVRTVIKSFVKDDGQTSISCPSCGVVRAVSVDKFRHKQHLLNVRCKCLENFNVQLEFRKHFRKPTDLTGLYSILPPDAGGGRMVVKNISRSGVGFSVSGVHSVEIGQKATLKFTLDNRKQTELFKEVIVKAVNSNYIGCRFVANQAFEKELGFYLRP